MKNMMRATLWIALLVLAALQISHAAVITNVSVPVNIPVFIPCAAGGTGELIVLSGDLRAREVHQEQKRRCSCCCSLSAARD